MAAPALAGTMNVGATTSDNWFSYTAEQAVELKWSVNARLATASFDHKTDVDGQGMVFSPIAGNGCTT